MPEFVIGETDFLLDGRPFRILSGALHYFRVHPDLWADRIDKARRMGLNTIETYVAVERARPVAGRVRPLRRARPRPVPAARRRRGDVRDRPARPVHLRGVGQRRAAGVAVPRPSVGVRRYEPRYLDAVRSYLTQRLRSRRAAPGRPGRAGAARPDRERVRRVRRRQAVPGGAGRAHAGVRDHRATDHGGPADRHARSGQPATGCTAPRPSARTPKPGSPSCARTSPPGR